MKDKNKDGEICVQSPEPTQPDFEYIDLGFKSGLGGKYKYNRTDYENQNLFAGQPKSTTEVYYTNMLRQPDKPIHK